MSIFVIIYISFSLFFFYTETESSTKVVKIIQFACGGNSGISRGLCNANTYRSIHEGLFFNSSPALDLKYPLRLPYTIFISLRFIYNIKLMAWHSFINISTNQIDSYILVVCQTTRSADNSDRVNWDRSKGLVRT